MRDKGHMILSRISSCAFSLISKHCRIKEVLREKEQKMSGIKP